MVVAVVGAVEVVAVHGVISNPHEQHQFKMQRLHFQVCLLKNMLCFWISLGLLPQYSFEYILPEELYYGLKWRVSSLPLSLGLSATEHIASEVDLLCDICPHTNGEVVHIPNQEGITVEGLGTATILNDVPLKDIFHISKFECNLTSVSRLAIYIIICAFTFFPDFCVGMAKLQIGSGYYTTLTRPACRNCGPPRPVDDPVFFSSFVTN